MNLERFKQITGNWRWAVTLYSWRAPLVAALTACIWWAEWPMAEEIAAMLYRKTAGELFAWQTLSVLAAASMLLSLLFDEAAHTVFRARGIPLSDVEGNDVPEPTARKWFGVAAAIVSAILLITGTYSAWFSADIRANMAARKGADRVEAERRRGLGDESLYSAEQGRARREAEAREASADRQFRADSLAAIAAHKKAIQWFKRAADDAAKKARRGAKSQWGRYNEMLASAAEAQRNGPDFSEARAKREAAKSQASSALADGESRAAALKRNENSRIDSIAHASLSLEMAKASVARRWIRRMVFGLFSIIIAMMFFIAYIKRTCGEKQAEYDGFGSEIINSIRNALSIFYKKNASRIAFSIENSVGRPLDLRTEKERFSFAARSGEYFRIRKDPDFQLVMGLLKNGYCTFEELADAFDRAPQKRSLFLFSTAPDKRLRKTVAQMIRIGIASEENPDGVFHPNERLLLTETGRKQFGENPNLPTAAFFAPAPSAPHSAHTDIEVLEGQKDALQTAALALDDPADIQTIDSQIEAIDVSIMALSE